MGKLILTKRAIRKLKRRFQIKDYTTLDLEKMLKRYYKKNSIAGPYGLNWSTPTIKEENKRKNFLWDRCLELGLV